jgi:hypothetical protein
VHHRAQGATDQRIRQILGEAIRLAFREVKDPAPQAWLCEEFEKAVRVAPIMTSHPASRRPLPVSGFSHRNARMVSHRGRPPRAPLVKLAASIAFALLHPCHRRHGLCLGTVLTHHAKLLGVGRALPRESNLHPLEVDRPRSRVAAR